MNALKNFLLVSLLVGGMAACTTNKSEHFRHPVTAAADTNVVLPPAWAFGVLFGGYTDQEGTIQRVKDIMAHDYPIDGYWIDSWFWDYQNHGMGPDKFMDFVADTVSYPDRKAMWGFLEENNIKGGFWVWDCIFETGNEEAFNDFKEKGYFKNIYVEKGSWHNKSTTTAMYEAHTGHKGTVCGNIDFNNPEAVAYFKQRMKHFFDEGADFLKLDRNSHIEICKAMFEMTQELGKETKGRGFIMSHTGGTEREEFKRYPTKWTDDTRADWSLDKPTKEFYGWVPKVALKENIEMYTDPNRKTSTIPFLTQDLGGFEKGKGKELDEELYIRWMEFALFCPVVEVFTQPENPTYNLPYLRSDRADSLFRAYSHLRMKLFPYIYSNAHRSRWEGKAMIRPTQHSIHDFTMGDNFLFAPVFEKGAVTRQLTFPEGTWMDFATLEEFEGGKQYTVDAPVEVIPMFVKAGSIIPMREYARSIEKGNNDVLTLHVYPGANGTFELIEDDGTSNDYLEGIYAKTAIRLTMTDNGMKVEIDPVLGSYEGMEMQRSWRISVHGKQPVKSISGNGVDLNLSAVNEQEIQSSLLTTNKNEATVFEIAY